MSSEHLYFDAMIFHFLHFLQQLDMKLIDSSVSVWFGWAWGCLCLFLLGWLWSGLVTVRSDFSGLLYGFEELGT